MLRPDRLKHPPLVGNLNPDFKLRVGPRPGLTVWMTGLSGAGKSTIAAAFEAGLHKADRRICVLDGDSLREGLNSNLGFSIADRKENARRTAEVAKLMNEAGMDVIAALISPSAGDRAMAREIVGPDRFLEVYVNAPLAVCERRDPKGFYARARKGEIANFTGISSPYEAPQAPDLEIDTERHSIRETVLLVRRFWDLWKAGYLQNNVNGLV
ncbi:MAG: adenylyl-sulfate kinase [Burkholderiales bacterium]